MARLSPALSPSFAASTRTELIHDPRLAYVLFWWIHPPPKATDQHSMVRAATVVRKACMFGGISLWEECWTDNKFGVHDESHSLSDETGAVYEAS